MISRDKYKDLLCELQVLYQNDYISAQKKNELVKIMVSQRDDSKDRYLKSILEIRSVQNEKICKKACERIISILTN